MKLNESQLHQIVTIISKKPFRELLYSFNINEGYSFTELRQFVEKFYAGKKRSATFNYYLHKCKDNILVRKDKRTGLYYLSRLGVETVCLMKNFEKVCMEYDLNDVDADGMLQVMVKR